MFCDHSKLMSLKVLNGEIITYDPRYNIVQYVEYIILIT